MPFSLRGGVSAAHSIDGMVLLDERAGYHRPIMTVAAPSTAP